MDLITTTNDLADACTRMAAHPFVTVDTEFLRESTYYPQLCVTQMASPDEAVVVDCLADGIDLKSFFDLMANEGVTKVFHAARQDIEIVWHRASLIPHPIFDTQVAAMVLGYGDSISYDQLVQRITGDTLDKSHRFTDWTRRPLSKAQVDLRDFRRDASARRLSEAQGRSRKARPHRMAQLGNGRADLARNLSDGTGKCLAAPAHAGAQAERAGGADRGCRLARTRGESARRPARPRAEGRSCRRYRGAGADLDRAAVIAALAPERLRAVEMGAGNPRSRQTRAGARSQDPAGDRTQQARRQRHRDRRASESAAAHDRRAARRGRQGDRDGGRSGAARRR